MADRLEARDAAQWQAWARGLLFVLGVASLLMAGVTFIAHNWVYLSTVGKLLFVGAFLVATAVAWMATRFDSPASQSFGIAAQLLIGVWLAAAGQLYQVPGGAQDLFLTWAVLGLPFAFASRSPAHWLVWIAVAALAIAMPWGERLSVLGELDARHRHAVLAVFGAGAYAIALKLRAPAWFGIGLAALAAYACLVTGVLAIFVFGANGIDALLFVFAVLLAGGLFWLALTKGRLASQALFATSGIAMLTALANRILLEGADLGLGFFLMLTIVNGGGTYLLVRVFDWLRGRHGGVEASAVADSDERAWYMDALIAVGGILTAIFAMTTVLALLTLTLAMDFESIGVPLTVIGLSLYALGLALRLRTETTFARYFFGTFALAGVVCVWVAIGVETESFRYSAVVPLILSLVALVLIRERMAEALFAATACVAVAAIVSNGFPGLQGLIGAGEVSHPFWREGLYLLVLGGAAVIAFTRPIRSRFLPAAGTVALLAATAFATWQGNAFGETSSLLDFWPLPLYLVASRIAVLALLVFAISRTSLGRNLPGLGLLALLILLAALMPPGGASALLLLLIAYLMGSKTLAVIGVLVTAIYYLWAYFDLSLTLLELSVLFAAGGLVMLVIWRLASRRMEVPA